MREYFTSGIVLDREPRNELDEDIIVYTKNLGKVRAFTKSSRKITSKLRGHLTPGRLANIRFVERNKLQLVDVLSTPTPGGPKELLSFLNFINKITPYGDADLSLWYMVEEIVGGNHLSPAIYRHLLERLGFGGEEVRCHYCENGEVNFFDPSETVFLCSKCRPVINIDFDELILLEKS